MPFPNFNSIEEMVSFIRSITGDRPETNMLFIGEVEWTDDEILSAVNQAISFYNMLPPHNVDLIYGTDQQPVELVFFSRLGTMALDATLYYMFLNKWIQNTRESVTSTPIPTIELDKHQTYPRVLQVLYEEVKRNLIARKADVNANQAWGIVEYPDSPEDSIL